MASGSLLSDASDAGDAVPRGRLRWPAVVPVLYGVVGAAEGGHVRCLFCLRSCFQPLHAASWLPAAWPRMPAGALAS